MSNEKSTAGEPVAWLVCSVNADGSLSLEHAAPFEEAAHEHINDAITKHGIEGASSWVVRPANIPPQPREPLTGENVTAMLCESGFATASAPEQAAFISGIRHCEAAHGIGGQA